MTRAHDLADLREPAADAIEERLPLDRVRLHQLELLLCEPRRLVQYLVGDRDLADVVKQRGDLELLARAVAEPQLVGDRGRELDHRAAVVRGVVVLGLHDVGEHHDRPAVRLVELERRGDPIAPFGGEDPEQPHHG